MQNKFNLKYGIIFFLIILLPIISSMDCWTIENSTCDYLPWDDECPEGYFDSRTSCEIEIDRIANMNILEQRFDSDLLSELNNTSLVIIFAFLIIIIWLIKSYRKR